MKMGKGFFGALAYAVAIVTLIALVPAASFGSGSKKTDEVLIKKGFRDDNSWIVIVRGYPKQDLTGVARMESAKRAALLNAYYFAKLTFDDTVAPDTDGKAVKWEISRMSAVVHYVISKPGLKNHIRTQEVPRNEGN